MSEQLIYSQSKGVLWHENPKGECRRLGGGYSGQPPHVNDAGAEALIARGPIPRGIYKVEHPFNHVRLGPQAFFLRPIAGNKMFGRSGFFIHGDNEYGNQTASHGCIILSRSVRDKIASLTPITLAVVD